jgi:Domain of unknown function (DUF4132)
MEPLSKLKAALSGGLYPVLEVQPWARELVQFFLDEAEPRLAYPMRRPQLKDSPGGQRILASGQAGWGELAAAILVRLKALYEENEAAVRAGVHTYVFWRRCEILREVLGRLLRPRLPYREERLAEIIEFCAANLDRLPDIPLGRLLRQVQHASKGLALEGALAAAVTRLLSDAQAMKSGWILPGRARALSSLVTRLRKGDSEPEPALERSPWRDQLLAEITTGESMEISRRVLKHALRAAGKPKPSQTFLEASRLLVADEPDLPARMMRWIEAYVPDPRHRDPNEDAIRGLIWMLAAGGGETLAPRVGAYCELCFKKIPKLGARSVKLGNGAIQTLAMLGGHHGIAELSRLRRKVRYPRVAQSIEQTISDLASRLDISEEELEERFLPTYDLSIDGERRLPVGDGSAIIRVTGTRNVQLTWARFSDREVATTPKVLRETAPEAVAAARALKKDIERALAGQAARVEALYLADRRIGFAQWRERYLEHPLVAGLARRLIWRFEVSGRSEAGFLGDGAIEDVSGRPIEPLPNSSVSLWHPLHARVEDVLAWRERLAALGVTQPFKQAHREIYVITDAEHQTDIYSNRFAAHILRQHQFKALCVQRGWAYHLMGPWNSHNTPTRTLPRLGLSVEFWVEIIDPAERSPSWVPTLIATDQVRFIGRDREPVRLTDVPPLVFSELMRDVDLFVGVASVGSDPNWMDGGPDTRFRAYWQSYAFGELTASGKTRAEVLKSLLPCLAVADRCELEERFLIVRGKLHTYKVHLGSANVQIAANNRYVCIVPGRGLSDFLTRERLVLPFEGDQTLSVILSKAFLLADDDKITDRSILGQINRS